MVHNLLNVQKGVFSMKPEIWLFVDGGAHLREKGNYDAGFNGSYAAIATIQHEGKLKRLTSFGGYQQNTTTPRMEFTALAHSLKHLNLVLYEPELWDTYGITEEGGTLYIVCDALNTVKTLTDWVHKWIVLTIKQFGKIFDRNEKGETIPMLHRKEKNKLVPVLNQDLIVSILQILDIYVKHGFTIKFIHIRSHIHKDKMEETRIIFQEFNNMLVSKEDFEELVMYNEMADDLVNSYYEKGEIENGRK